MSKFKHLAVDEDLYKEIERIKKYLEENFSDDMLKAPIKISSKVLAWKSRQTRYEITPNLLSQILKNEK